MATGEWAHNFPVSKDAHPAYINYPAEGWDTIVASWFHDIFVALDAIQDYLLGNTPGGLTYEMNFATGNDSTGDGSAGNPFKTATHCLSLFPSYIPGGVVYKISVQDDLTWAEKVRVERFWGPGVLQFDSKSSDATKVLNTMDSDIMIIENCRCKIEISYISARVTDDNRNCFTVDGSKHVKLIGVRCADNDNANTRGIMLTGMAIVHAFNCTDYDAKKVSVGIDASVSSRFGNANSAFGDVNFQLDATSRRWE